MAIAEHIQAEQRVTLHDIDWPTYLKLRDQPENYHVRMTYDRGELEMMSPSRLHERLASLLGGLIEAWAEERGIDIGPCGTMTFRREDRQRGLEPDKCYYVAHEPLVRDKEELDLTADPPPDLAVEIDLGTHAFRKLSAHAGFHVPEVWRYDGRTLEIYTLDADGRYQSANRSASFPELPPGEIERVLAQLGTASETALVRSFRQWVRTTTERT